MKHLVLLGGGRSHLHVLGELAKAPLPTTRVTLVAPLATVLHPGLLAGWMAGHHEMVMGQVSLADIARRAQVKFIESRATDLHAADRRLVLANGEVLAYDQLSIDTSGVMDRDAIDGARENALFVRPLRHFVQLWETMLMLADQRSLNVVVIGSGADAVELAMATQHRLKSRARVALVTHGGPPLPDAPAAVQARVRRVLKRGQVTLFEDNCSAITGSQVRLAKGFSLACDAPLIALECSAPGWAADSGLTLDAHGFVVTDDSLHSPSHPEVFAVGWASARKIEHAGAALALNLRRFAAGGQLLPARGAAPRWQLLSCGDRHGLASFGSLSLEGRWVWWLKERMHRADLDRWHGGASGRPPAPSEVAAIESDHHR